MHATSTSWRLIAHPQVLAESGPEHTSEWRCAKMESSQNGSNAIIQSLGSRGGMAG